MQINVILAFMIIISFLIALALHEFGHALMASLLGDQTPRKEGRQSLRLRSHIDAVGLLMCVILAFQPVNPVGFGWGKPVKPDPWKMRVGPNAGVLLVALAGPVISLIIGLLVAVIVRFLPPALLPPALLSPASFQLLILNHPAPLVYRIPQFLITFASVNICLALFNIIPLYPLDGYQILYTLLPSRQAVQFAKSAPYGPFIILVLFFLLPFLGTFSGLGNFPLFQLAYYILLGSLQIISPIVGSLVYIYSLR